MPEISVNDEGFLEVFKIFNAIVDRHRKLPGFFNALQAVADGKNPAYYKKQLLEGLRMLSEIFENIEIARNLGFDPDRKSTTSKEVGKRFEEIDVSATDSQLMGYINDVHEMGQLLFPQVAQIYRDAKSALEELGIAESKKER